MGATPQGFEPHAGWYGTAGSKRVLYFQIQDVENEPLSLLSATYVLRDGNRDPVVTKTLGNGIDLVDANQRVLSVTLESTDLEGLNGQYYDDMDLTYSDGDPETGAAFGVAHIRQKGT